MSGHTDSDVPNEPWGATGSGPSPGARCPIVFEAEGFLFEWIGQLDSGLFLREEPWDAEAYEAVEADETFGPSQDIGRRMVLGAVRHPWEDDDGKDRECVDDAAPPFAPRDIVEEIAAVLIPGRRYRITVEDLTRPTTPPSSVSAS